MSDMEYIALLTNTNLEANATILKSLRSKADHAEYIAFEKLDALILRAKQSTRPFTRIVVSPRGLDGSLANLNRLHKFVTEFALQTTVVFWVLKGKNEDLHKAFHNTFTSSMYTDAMTESATLRDLMMLCLEDIGSIRERFTGFTGVEVDVLRVGDFEKQDLDFAKKDDLSFQVKQPIGRLIVKPQKKPLLAFLSKNKVKEPTPSEEATMGIIFNENKQLTHWLSHEVFLRVTKRVPDDNIKREVYEREGLMRFSRTEGVVVERLVPEHQMVKLSGIDFMGRLSDAYKYGEPLNLKQSGFRNSVGVVVTGI